VVPALNLIEQGVGRSRRVAEQEAARRMLDALKRSDKPGGPLQS
jgi:ribonuclease III